MTLSPATPRLVASALRRAEAGPFDIAVQAGECLAIVGPSGSGKSLLLRMLADLDPHDGAVTLDGRDQSSFSGPEWRRRVAYAAAEPGWWDDDVAAHLPADRYKTAVRLALRLGLTEQSLAGSITRLSTGERARLGLVRVLTGEPPVLLLDEPTGSLDAEATARVEEVLRERLAEGVAMVLVTHSADQAGRLGARTRRMSAGMLGEPT